MSSSLYIHWFRKGLRLHDNPALVNIIDKINKQRSSSSSAASSSSSSRPAPRLLLLYVVDVTTHEYRTIGAARWRFIRESLSDLRRRVASIGGELIIAKGDPLSLLKQIAKTDASSSSLSSSSSSSSAASSSINTISYEIDADPSAHARDAAVVEWVSSQSMSIIAESSHTLYDYSLTAGNKLPKTYESFLKFASTQRKIGPCVPAPTSLPSSSNDDSRPELDAFIAAESLSDEQLRAITIGVHDDDIQQPLPSHVRSIDRMMDSGAGEEVEDEDMEEKKSSDKKAKSEPKQTSMSSYVTSAASSLSSSSSSSSSKSKSFSIKNRAAFSTASSYFLGGESEGVRRMVEYLSDVDAVRAFKKPDTLPSALVPSTTTLSPYLHFGCVSIRHFYHSLHTVIDGHPASTAPPVSLIGQVMWREFFHHCAAHTANYHQMANNDMCRAIGWLPDGSDDENRFMAAWEGSKTGFPWIDALMAQLREHGWMHHLGRHSVACFLTRGDMYVSWEKGREVFDKYLVDADYPLNNSNWMWLSASAFFHQYWKVYSPIAFGQKGDPDGAFIRHFLPVLRLMPSKYIYSPWLAPVAIQKSANCIIGVDYPHPIISDHTATSKVNMAKHKAAYAIPKPNAKAKSSSLSSTKKRKDKDDEDDDDDEDEDDDGDDDKPKGKPARKSSKTSKA